jgi:hypothetical protein
MHAVDEFYAYSASTSCGHHNTAFPTSSGGLLISLQSKDSWGKNLSLQLRFEAAKIVVTVQYKCTLICREIAGNYTSK